MQLLISTVIQIQLQSNLFFSVMFHSLLSARMQLMLIHVTLINEIIFEVYILYILRRFGILLKYSQIFSTHIQNL